MKSTDTGTKNAITVNADISFRHPAGGQAQDAQVRMDGIIIKRSSNEFDDLVEGVKLTLDKVGKSTVEISQDSGKISETMQSFVTQYNEILDSVATMTNYDPDTKNAGVFQGSSEIRNMMGALKDIFSTTISSAGKMSSDFGLSADKKGKLTFDKDTFELALGKDTKAIQNFFVGEGASEGIFRKMDGEIFNIKTNSSGVFKTLQSNYDSKERTLSEALERAQKRLDSKYEIMQKRFASYDAVIGRLSSASTMLTSLIDAQSPK
jgi:flagellar hook-associated protein 2